METFWTRIFVKNVCERDKTHSLMVGHKSANEHRLLIFRQSLGGVVDRFVKAIRSKCAFFLKASQIVDRGERIDARSQHRRVRGDDEVFDQATFEAETGNAKGSILIIEMKIAHVVGGFRNSPWHATLVAV